MAHYDGDTEHVVTVETLLAEPLLHGSVLAGKSGLGNVVTWCLPLSDVDDRESLNTVDSATDLTGVVVHVDAVQLSSGERSQALVSSLATRGTAALLAWSGHYAGDLDTAAHAADSAALPLIAVAPEADFRHTSHLVATKVLAQEAHVLEYSARVHRTLGEVFARGSGLVAIARTMSQLSRTPVLVLGLEGEVLAQAEVTDKSAPVTGGLADVAARWFAEHRPERTGVTDPVPGSAPHARRVVMSSEEGTVHATVAPVTVAGESYGTVLLVERAWPPDEHDLAQHAVIAEQGAVLTASELLRQRSIREAEERARDDFVDALLHGRFTDHNELAARARHYRFNPEGTFAVFVVTSPSLSAGRTPRTIRAGDAVRALGTGTPDGDLLTLTAQIGSMIVIVHELRSASRQDAALADRAARNNFAEHVRRVVGERIGDEVMVAHGRSGIGASGVEQSYREARSAATLADRIGASRVCGYDGLRIFAAVHEVASTASGRSFATEVLGPLRRVDGQTGNLEEIVLAYINESGNLNAAARRLHLHRNTILYKLDRASRALQMDIRTAETQFTVWLAHHIDTLSEVQSVLDDELAPSPT